MGQDRPIEEVIADLTADGALAWDGQRIVLGPLAYTDEVLADIRAERVRQVAKYGTNDDLEDGTGPDVAWLQPLSPITATAVEDAFRVEYELHEAIHGKPTWLRLVREEIGEAFKESDPERLEAELIQAGALCASWVERLRARKEKDA